MIIDGKNLFNRTRSLTANIFNNVHFAMSVEDSMILSISKFIALKEFYIKKRDCNGKKNEIVFDMKLGEKALPSINKLCEYVSDNGIYCPSLNYDVVLLNTKDEFLKKNILLMQKIRDSLAHFKYVIDTDKKSICINNKDSSNLDAGVLICDIPIEYFNISLDYMDSKYDLSSIEEYVKSNVINILKRYENRSFDINGNISVPSLNNIRALRRKLEGIRYKNIKAENYYEKMAKKLIEDIVLRESGKKMLDELELLLGLEGEDNKAVILYHYLSIVLADDNKDDSLDYRYLNTKDIQMISWKKKDSYIANKWSNADNINATCNNIINSCINYKIHPSDNYLKSIIKMYLDLINNTMNSIAYLNKEKVRMIRNGIMHANYYNGRGFTDIVINDRKDNTKAKKDDINTSFFCKYDSLFELGLFCEGVVTIGEYTFRDLINSSEILFNCTQIAFFRKTLEVVHEIALEDKFDENFDVNKVKDELANRLVNWDDRIKLNEGNYLKKEV